MKKVYVCFGSLYESYEQSYRFKIDLFHCKMFWYEKNEKNSLTMMPKLKTHKKYKIIIYEFKNNDMI